MVTHWLLTCTLLSPPGEWLESSVESVKVFARWHYCKRCTSLSEFQPGWVNSVELRIADHQLRCNGIQDNATYIWFCPGTSSTCIAWCI